MSACSSRHSWMVLYIALLVTLVSQSEGGCQDTGLCCIGQNQSCITEDWRKDHSYGECYCDQACKTTSDCCHDYDLACPAVSCVVSEWSMWSGCLEPCKPTMHTRQRQVIQEAHNRGEPCPSLHQTAGCAEYHDQHGPCLQFLDRRLRGVSRPAWSLPTISSYCVEFKLTSLTADCQRSFSLHTRWMRYLKEGHQVCVECQPPALAQGQRYCSGDGENMGQDSMSLQWQAVGNSRCRGLWRRVRRRDSCSCPTVHSFLFI
uniref:Somatomedin-B and thrombospondin type-1 domain-containing protein-like n=1 Tax=Sinocyclocheilus rhinocerous TaxID=307959 RepID=A0A673MHX3_9TELE